MDKNYTTAIKGVAILTVLWAHSGAKLGVEGIQFIAGTGVSLFLICSGYRLELSYQKNGINQFWKRRFLKICIPFWVVELIGEMATGVFTIKKYVLVVSFIKTGWYLQYILICYMLFYLIKIIVVKQKLNPHYETSMFLSIFAVWFVVESVLFANPDMPFLRARQMLSFPCGVLLAMNKNKIEQILTKKKSALILGEGGTLCFLFMLVTQLQVVKELPYLVSNIMALLTCFPMAIGIMVFGKAFNKLFQNRILAMTGEISYELYLIHAFTLRLIKQSVIRIFIFVVVTYMLAYILHMVMRKVK